MSAPSLPEPHPTNCATRGSSASGRPIHASSPSGSADLLTEVRADAATGHAADDLADQPAVRGRVVSVLRPGLPQRRLPASASTTGSHASASSRLICPSMSGRPTWCESSQTTGTSCLPACAELGPVLARPGRRRRASPPGRACSRTRPSGPWWWSTRGRSSPPPRAGRCARRRSRPRGRPPSDRGGTRLKAAPTSFPSSKLRTNGRARLRSPAPSSPASRSSFPFGLRGR